MSSWSLEVNKRLARAKQDLSRQVYLSHCSICDSLFPTELFSLRSLVRLDLGFNNLSAIDPRIGELKQLQELWLNDNPLVAMPVSVSNLRALRTLDLRNTLIRNVPREFAVLNNLQDLNLQGCPLKKSIGDAYAEGRDSLFSYLRRKHERRMFKKDFERLLRENIYPFDDHQALHELCESVFLMLKKCTSEDLSKLVRHGKRILPKEMVYADPKQVLESIKGLNEEENARNQIGDIQLRLRAIFPEMPLDVAHHHAADLQGNFSKAELRDIFRNPGKIFPEDHHDVAPEKTREAYRDMLVDRADDNLRARIRKAYPDVEDGQVELLLDQLLQAADDDRGYLSRCLESSLPATLEECMAVLDSLKHGESMALVEPGPDLDDTLLAENAREPAGEGGEGGGDMDQTLEKPA